MKKNAPQKKGGKFVKKKGKQTVSVPSSDQTVRTKENLKESENKNFEEGENFADDIHKKDEDRYSDHEEGIISLSEMSDNSLVEYLMNIKRKKKWIR